MPVTPRRSPALDFKCGPRGVLSRGKCRLPVGERLYLLATYLVHQRAVSVRAVKVRVWGEAGGVSDNAVSKLGQRLNEKLAGLGSETRVSIHDGRVELK